MQHFFLKIEGSAALKSYYNNRTLHRRNSIVPEHEALFGAKYLLRALAPWLMLCEWFNQVEHLKGSSASPNLGAFSKLTHWVLALILIRQPLTTRAFSYLTGRNLHLGAHNLELHLISRGWISTSKLVARFSMAFIEIIM